MKATIPLMKSCPNYSHWKKMIEVWASVTEVPKEKQTNCIILTLESDGQNLALQIPDVERSAPDGSGVKKLLEKLDSLYEKNKTQRIFQAFEEFFEPHSRPHSTSIAKYISEFDMKISNLKDLGVSLPDSVLAYQLLKSAGLNEQVAQIVRATCRDLTLDDMKNAILNVHDVRLKADGESSQSSSWVSDHNIKQEPDSAFLSNQSSSDFTGNQYRGNQAHYSRGYNSRGSRGRGRSFHKNPKDLGMRTNRTDPYTGKPEQCHICGSRYHFSYNCSRNGRSNSSGSSNRPSSSATNDTFEVRGDRQFNSDNAANNTSDVQTVNLNMFATDFSQDLSL